MVVGLVGVGVGVGGRLSALLPQKAHSATVRAEQALLADTAASLRRAIDDTVGLPEAQDVSALAHALIWREHGGSEAHRALAEQALVGSARTTPRGLYARALLAEGDVDLLRGAQTNDNLHDSVVDRLDADLARAGDDVYTLLARASRASDPRTRLGLLERAATLSPSLHASVRWARAAAAAGDVPLARAALGRVFGKDPEHAGALVTAVVVGVIEELKLPASRRRSAQTLFPDEARLRESVLERGQADDDDTALLVVMDHALQMARQTELSSAQRERLVTVTEGREALAQSVVELALLRGDLTTAAAVLKGHRESALPGLVVATTRERILQALSAEARRERLRAFVVDEGLSLRLAWAFGHAQLQVDRPGVPLTPTFSTTVYPERRIAAALTEQRRSGEAERLKPRLQRIEAIVAAERALAADDRQAAQTHLVAAASAAGPSAEISLVEAQLASRKGDIAAAINAIDAAIAATADPEVWLTAAQRSLDVGYQAGARRALMALFDRGLRSARAQALLAVLETKSGDLLAAQAAQLEAARLGGSDDDPWMLVATIVTTRLTAPHDARQAATKLRALGVDAGDPVVDVWVADAAARAGDPQGATRLSALKDAHPEVPEVHLLWAQAHVADPTRRNDVVASATRATVLLSGPLAVEARAFLASAKAAAKGAAQAATTTTTPPRRATGP
jgi:tetratricopeptide (TPR) repeat protein